MKVKNQHIRYLLLFFLSLSIIVILLNSCSNAVPGKRIFEGYGLWMDTVFKSPEKIVRCVEIGTTLDVLKKTETIAPTEEDSLQLYYEIKVDSFINASIVYSFSHNKIDEIEIILRCKNEKVGAGVFSDIKNYFQQNYQGPLEENGVLLFAGKTSLYQPFLISLKEDGLINNPQINLLVYTEK